MSCLADALGRGHLTRADDHIPARCRQLEEIAQQFDRHGQIGVAHESVLAGREQHAMPDGRALAAVWYRLEPKFVAIGRPRAHSLPGRIGAAVVNDNDFPRVRLIVQVVRQCLQRSTNSRLFVKDGNDHRKEGGGDTYADRRHVFTPRIRTVYYTRPWWSAAAPAMPSECHDRGRCRTGYAIVEDPDGNAGRDDEPDLGVEAPPAVASAARFISPSGSVGRA